jgi:4-hydroxy-tetrahydrodipicolinate reductase
MTTHVVVAGARGRMGSWACGVVEEAPDLTLHAAVGRGDDLAGALEHAHVLVDLTVPDSSPDVVATALRHGVHAVVGTTGWDGERLAGLRHLVHDHPGTGVLVAPNFAVGALLLQRFAAAAARWFESVEIVELHHPDKADAPSGTARRIAHAVSAARTAAEAAPMPDATARALPGARGTTVDGVPVHSARLRGLLAHHEVLLGGPGEVLMLRHDSLDRSSFRQGLLLAVREVAWRPGLTVGLENWLDV